MKVLCATEALELMRPIKYGYVDKDKNINLGMDENFSLGYRLQSPELVLKNKVGICWDQVELERHLLTPAVNDLKTYFMVLYDGKNCPTHTFLTYEENGAYYWFEHSWEMFRGIHKFSSKKELLLDVRNKFITYELNNTCDLNSLHIHEYTRPAYGLTCPEFYEHCDNGPYIDLNEVK